MKPGAQGEERERERDREHILSKSTSRRRQDMFEQSPPRFPSTVITVQFSHDAAEASGGPLRSRTADGLEVSLEQLVKTKDNICLIRLAES